MIKPKKCPFCGGELRIEQQFYGDGHDAGYIIECHNCLATVEGAFNSVEDAVEWWNRRYEEEGEDNNMIIKGSEIVLKKMLPGMEGSPLEVGMIFEVNSVDKNGLSLSIPHVGYGRISYDEFYEYFEPYKKPEKRVWTDWKAFYPKNENEAFIWSYKTNGKAVEVKMQNYKGTVQVKGRATCHKDDKFDLDKGIALAKARALVNYALRDM